MYAVVQTGGKQYRVAAGQMLEVESLEVDPGQSVVFDDVRLVQHDGRVTVGKPRVEGASVVADVVGHKRGPKIVIYRMKRRKGFRRKAGHRQELTVVRVKEINA